MQAQAERIIEEFGEAIMRRDFEALAELLHDDLSYEICGLELEGAGVFDKPTVLARLPQVLSLFEDGGPRMTITRSFHDGD
jgi:ketosteroid isomerase-like protein